VWIEPVEDGEYQCVSQADAEGKAKRNRKEESQGHHQRSHKFVPVPVSARPKR
jgi:hypothetical protein